MPLHLVRAKRSLASDASVSVLVVRGLVQAVDHAGVPSSDFLRAVGWDTVRVRSVDARVPLSEVFRICDLALDVTNDEALGLHCAERLGHYTFAPISHLLAHVTTLRQAFELLSEFAPLLCDLSFFALSESQDTAVVRIPHWPSPSRRIHRFTSEAILAGIAKMFRLMLPRAELARTSFDYAAPRYSGEYMRILQTKVVFGQPFTGIFMSRALLDVPLNYADDEVFNALRVVAQGRLERALGRKSYTVGVRELMLHQGPGRVSMADAAHALGLSVRSLRRRLTSEGTSFRVLKHSALGSASKALLRDSVRTVQEIASELGFNDVTTFHRAFKRWTGTTPTRFRGTPDEAGG